MVVVKTKVYKNFVKLLLEKFKFLFRISSIKVLKSFKEFVSIIIVARLS